MKINNTHKAMWNRRTEQLVEYAESCILVSSPVIDLLIAVVISEATAGNREFLHSAAFDIICNSLNMDHEFVRRILTRGMDLAASGGVWDAKAEKRRELEMTDDWVIGKYYEGL